VTAVRGMNATSTIVAWLRHAEACSGVAVALPRRVRGLKSTSTIVAWLRHAEAWCGVAARRLTVGGAFKPRQRLDRRLPCRDVVGRHAVR